MCVDKRLVIVAATLAVTTGSVSLYENLTRHATLPSGSLESQTQYWEEQIKAIGPSAAYQELARDLANADPATQHGNAHIFGGALYEVEGLSGITTCDAQFSSGCFHELIGRAIANNGLAVVKQLNAYCIGKNGCQHGIGHGLVSYLGYTDGDLRRAIAVCQSLPGPDTNTLQGCLGGIFMEYSVRTMLSVDGGSARPATSSSDLLAPCDEFSGIVERSCFFYQPQWWNSIFGDGKDASAFPKMGHLCDKVSGENRSVCYAGIGLMAPPASSYDASSSISMCLGASATSSSRMYCLLGAAFVYRGTGRSDSANTVCDTLTGSAEQMCIAYSGDAHRMDNL